MFNSAEQIVWKSCPGHRGLVGIMSACHRNLITNGSLNCLKTKSKKPLLVSSNFAGQHAWTLFLNIIHLFPFPNLDILGEKNVAYLSVCTFYFFRIRYILVGSSLQDARCLINCYIQLYKILQLIALKCMFSIYIEI